MPADAPTPSVASDFADRMRRAARLVSATNLPPATADFYRAELERGADAIEELEITRARLRDAEADRERLDWLENAGAEYTVRVLSQAGGPVAFSGYKGLRAALDAARGEGT